MAIRKLQSQGVANNISLPGDQGITIPVGNTSTRPLSPTVGQIRYNTDINNFEIYKSSGWAPVTSGSDSLAYSIALG